MAKEIERCFLLKEDHNFAFLHHRTYPSRMLEYGYLGSPADGSVCIRLVYAPNGLEARINTKSGGSKIEREEFETKIPVDMATWMIENQCKYRLRKIRHFVDEWEIDEFVGMHSGLFLAEVELNYRDAALPHLPPWIGAEVTEDSRYKNENIAKQRTIVF